MAEGVTLESLGSEKLLKIRNELMRGSSSIKVARLVKSWGDFPTMEEATLVRKLLRLRRKIIKESYGQAPSEPTNSLKELVVRPENIPTQIKSIKHFRKLAINPLEELVAMSEVQRERIDRMWRAEAEKGKGDPILSMVLEDYKRLMLDIQKTRFELGLDPFHGTATAAQLKGTQATMTLPDGTQLQKTVFEAAKVVDSIFHMRGINDPQAEV